MLASQLPHAASHDLATLPRLVYMITSVSDALPAHAGSTVGFGWRWIGVSYTNIRYTSPVTGGLDGSSGGITFAWKF